MWRVISRNAEKWQRVKSGKSSWEILCGMKVLYRIEFCRKYIKYRLLTYHLKQGICKESNQFKKLKYEQLIIGTDIRIVAF